MGSCICGFHIYQDMLTCVVGKVLGGQSEATNTEDMYTIAVYKSEVVVCHVCSVYKMRKCNLLY